MKAVLISIKPKWCDLIRRGRKTVEVRKTCPKLEVPFKVYIYETMDGGRGSGLVFGEFVCNGFDVFRPIGKGISIKRFPALKAAMPAAQKKARRQIDVLTRAKERLMELMEEPQK